MWAVMCFCCHVCHTQARSCLSTGWTLNRCFAWFFGTAAVLAQGGGGVHDFEKPFRGLQLRRPQPQQDLHAPQSATTLTIRVVMAVLPNPLGTSTLSSSVLSSFLAIAFSVHRTTLFYSAFGVSCAARGDAHGNAMHAVHT